MARHVNIHIGLPKTASTALQRGLAAHQQTLASIGAVYPTMSGRPDQRGAIADLQLRHIQRSSSNREAHAKLSRRADVGSWEDLVTAVRTANATALVVDEQLSSMPTFLAQRVVAELTDNSADQARVVFVVRPLSELLVSAYAQLALDTVVPSFDTWVRVWLRARLQRFGTNTAGEWTDGFQVARTWGATKAEVFCVHYQADSAQYWFQLLSALGLAEVADQITVPRANPSMTALGLAAWQTLLRSGHDPLSFKTRQLRKAVRNDLPEVREPTLGGRLSLTPEVASLVDTVFSQPAAGRVNSHDIDTNDETHSKQPYLARLVERLHNAEPLTIPPLAEHCRKVQPLAQRMTSLAERPGQ